jgi:chromosome segregation ATPase
MFCEQQEKPMIDDSNCHCGPCTAMNEPLTLEGDIRYLKAHIDTKDRQLADANLRINVYKEAWQDAERDSEKLREEKNRQHNRLVELDDTVMRLAEENRLLQEEKGRLTDKIVALRHDLEAANRHKERYQQEIIDLERHNEELFAALNNVRNILNGAADGIEQLIRVD